MSARLFRTELLETDDSGELQTTKLQGLAGEEMTEVHRVGYHGLHSVAPVGSHGLGLRFLREGRTLAAVLGLEHQDHRPKKRDPGSTALYDVNGNMISLVQKELRVTGKKTTVVEGADKTTVKRGDLVITIREGRVDLGAEEGTHAVMTQAGLSSTVFAKI